MKTVWGSKPGMNSEEKKPTSKQGINHYKQAKEVQDKCIATIERKMEAMETLQKTTSTNVKMVIKLVKDTAGKNYDSIQRCTDSLKKDKGITDTLKEQLDIMRARMDTKEAEEAKEAKEKADHLQ